MSLFRTHTSIHIKSINSNESLYPPPIFCNRNISHAVNYYCKSSVHLSAMLLERPRLHPGIICAVASVPIIFIVVVAFVILKGFDLLPSVHSWNPGNWGFWSTPSKRNSEEEVSLDPVGSCSTIHSTFIGQRKDESVKAVAPPQAIYHATLPANALSKDRMPSAPANHQENETQTESNWQSQKDEHGHRREFWKHPRLSRFRSAFNRGQETTK